MAVTIRAVCRHCPALKSLGIHLYLSKGHVLAFHPNAKGFRYLPATSSRLFNFKWSVSLLALESELLIKNKFHYGRGGGEFCRLRGNRWVILSSFYV